MNKQRGFTATELFVLILVVAGIVGWLANVFKLVDMLDGPVTAMFIARIVGVFMAPLGSILGVF